MKARKIRLAVAAAILGVAWAHASLAEGYLRSPEIVIRSDRGGSVVDYARRVSSIRSQNMPVEFRGSCQSACTLLLSLPAAQVCISQGASFGFHRAYGASSEANAWATGYMLKKYPKWVRQWIDANGGLSSRMLRMDYAYAARFLQRCAA